MCLCCRVRWRGGPSCGPVCPGGPASASGLQRSVPHRYQTHSSCQRKRRVARRKYRSAMGVAQVMVKGDMMRTNLMSSIMDLWRSNVVSVWQLAASLSLESGISDCSSPWPPSASLLTSDVSPLGSEVNSYSSSSSSSSSTFTSSSPLTGRTHSAIEN